MRVTEQKRGSQMPQTATKSADEKTETRQDTQKRLVEQAERTAGVADAIRVYGRLARYEATIATEQPTLRHSSGTR